MSQSSQSSQSIVITNANPATLRLVTERWYHRLWDRWRPNPSKENSIPVGRVCFEVLLSSKGQLYATQSCVDIEIGTAHQPWRLQKEN